MYHHKAKQTPVLDLSPFFENQNEVLNVAEAALFLGFSERTIYNMVRHHRIPHRRIGRSIRFLKEDLIKMIRET